MPAAEGPQGIFRPCKAPDAADADCIGKTGNEAGAEKILGADPSGVLKQSLSPSSRAVHGLWSGAARKAMESAVPAR